VSTTLFLGLGSLRHYLVGNMLASRGALPWVEKYRPRTVAEVSHQEEVVATLQKIVHSGALHGDMPHMLLYGPPGTGKTSSALALCRDLFGTGELYRTRVLEQNASDERGIQVVREKIKTFAQRTVSVAPRSADKPMPPPFKVILLDEADAITADAQTALRRTMETHSRTTRFILICNYVSKIIAPLASRCAKFRFQPLPPQAMISRLKFIAKEETVNVQDDTLNELIESSDGDLRKAITTLQSTHRITKPGTMISSEDVANAACLVPGEVLNDFDVSSADATISHKALRGKVDSIVRDGFSTAELLSRYSARIMASDGPGVAKLSDVQKGAIAIAVARAEANLVDGADELMQTYSVVSKISTAVRNASDLEVLKTL
jgi:replication factor C subunit 2/4